MNATISKDFAWSASHVLDGLPEDHQCGRLHGHNYVARVTLSGKVVAPGFVVDYGELAPIKQLVDDVLDHRHLNDVLPFNPTAEHLAEWLLQKVRVLMLEHKNVTGIAVSVSETPKTWATVSAEL